jgi:hypothetical protein
MSRILDSLKNMKVLHDKIAETCTMRPQQTIHSLVLRHGLEFKGSARPDWLQRGTPKECFTNASVLATMTGVVYVEGFVMRASLPIPIHHGWCIDDDGTVLDPTIDRPEECEYYGIPINQDFLFEQLEQTSMYGLLDNHKTTAIYVQPPETFVHIEWYKP